MFFGSELLTYEVLCGILKKHIKLILVFWKSDIGELIKVRL